MFLEFFDLNKIHLNTLIHNRKIADICYLLAIIQSILYQSVLRNGKNGGGLHLSKSSTPRPGLLGCRRQFHKEKRLPYSEIVARGKYM